MDIFQYVMAGFLGSLSACLIVAGGGLALLVWSERRRKKGLEEE